DAVAGRRFAGSGLVTLSQADGGKPLVPGRSRARVPLSCRRVVRRLAKTGGSAAGDSGCAAAVGTHDRRGSGAGGAFGGTGVVCRRSARRTVGESRLCRRELL